MFSAGDEGWHSSQFLQLQGGSIHYPDGEEGVNDVHLA